jgi:DNA anti-recombination protein RmuC
MEHLPMEILVPVIAAVVAALLTLLIARSVAARHLAEARAALAGEIATAKADNRWLTEELTKQQLALGSTQGLLDEAQQRLRDSFQALAAEALKDNRSSFLDLAKTSFE